MKSLPKLYKVTIIILGTIWIIVLYQQYLHYTTTPQYYYDWRTHSSTSIFDPIRHIPHCRNDTTTTSSSSTSSTTVRSIEDDYNNNPKCRNELNRVTYNMIDHVPGLTYNDYQRSIAHVGNRYRLSQFVTKLIQSTTTASTIVPPITSNASTHNTVMNESNHSKSSPSQQQQQQQPVTVIVCGGSITMGHGVQPQSDRYSDALELYFNTAYTPIMAVNSGDTDFTIRGNGDYNYENNYPHRHRVYMRGGHGANICSMAKRLNYLEFPREPDLFILEFAVNDYQAEDQNTFLHHKTDVYFDGFETFVECSEIVIGRLLIQYPNAAIIFLELHSAVPNRKTAQSLHIGVAQHYQIPVLSYADVMMPDYFRLIETLRPYQYSLPSHLVSQIEIDFPYPHGCAPCRIHDLTDQFQPDGCWSLCWLMKEADIYSGTFSGCDPKRKNMLPCYVPIFDHDEVHPSKTGHKIIRDLIVHLLAQIAYDLCHGRTYTPYQLPIHGGWMIAQSDSDKSYMTDLLALSDYVTVQDIKRNFADTEPLIPFNHTNGFAIVDDIHGRKGWVATKSSGGESITFTIDVIEAPCYVVYLTILKSYKTVGAFTVTVYDMIQQKVTKSIKVDALWNPKISVPVDIALTSDQSNNECTGQCNITITTHPAIQGRGGNLIKITSLAARRCV